jgi:hypothetical protein
MKEVKIEIVDTGLEDMGVEQPTRYASLRFNESHFIGYWIPDHRETISFYLGSQSFVCKNTQYNVELFESILKNHEY